MGRYNRNVFYIDETLSGTFVWSIVELSDSNSLANKERLGGVLQDLFMEAWDGTLLMIDCRWVCDKKMAIESVCGGVQDAVTFAESCGEDKATAAAVFGRGPLAFYCKSVLASTGWLV